MRQDDEIIENYVFPTECQAIIDVTKPPYNIDSTGTIDCTKQLCAMHGRKQIFSLE